MASLCFGSVKAKVVRYTRLDSCGIPVVGASSVIVSDGFTKVEPSPNYEDGEDFALKNAWGDYCVDEKEGATLRDTGLAIDHCSVNPHIAEMVGGARLILDGADVVGAAFPRGANGNHFALETWTKVAGDACDGGDQQWVYWVWPHLFDGRVGGFALERAALTMPFTATTKGAVSGVNWFDEGPYEGDDVYLTDGLEPGEDFGFAVTTLAPPDPACAASALAALTP